MNAKTSVFVICVEVIIYMLLYNLRECSFKGMVMQINKLPRYDPFDVKPKL